MCQNALGLRVWLHIKLIDRSESWKSRVWKRPTSYIVLFLQFCEMLKSWHIGSEFIMPHRGRYQLVKPLTELVCWVSASFLAFERGWSNSWRLIYSLLRWPFQLCWVITHLCSPLCDQNPKEVSVPLNSDKVLLSLAQVQTCIELTM